LSIYNLVEWLLIVSVCESNI